MLDDGFGCGAASTAEQPIQGASKIVFTRLTQDSGDNLPLFIEDECRREFVSQPGAFQHVEIGTNPNLHPELVIAHEFI